MGLMKNGINFCITNPILGKIKNKEPPTKNATVIMIAMGIDN